MFLKRIELQGFKSFADKTILNFEKGVTGIVGPNGCGKSNVTDAVRWVLGEQSAKSLRSGTSMADIIFAGSQARKPVNIAKVSLVFDNAKGIFPAAFEEVEISRLIHRSKETEYAINRTACRLKDIQDLVMDTGLGRDSLSIISQGNISSFADAKPEERRALFEEAAGVAKYKKRKKESLQKLEQTHANLERLQDILDELDRQLGPLEKQAAKARQARALKKELADIEVTVLAEETAQQKALADQLEERLAKAQADAFLAESTQEQKESQLEAIRKENRQLDILLNEKRTRYTELLQHSVQLEKRKTELDEKQKRQLEQAQGQERGRQLAILHAQAQAEYQDRKNRLDEWSRRIQALSEERGNAQRILSRIQAQEGQVQEEIRRMQNRLAGLEAMLKNPWSHQQGVQAVMQASRSLYGIEGTVSQLLPPKKGMALAIGAALGGAVHNIVTTDERAARQAIRFLKDNRAGRATFLPKTVCSPRLPSRQQMTIVQSLDGVVGWASQLVQTEKKHEAVRDRLLANILVCETLEQANEASRMLNRSVKIVTLDGDIIHTGGMMTGGSVKSGSSPLTLQEDKERLEAAIVRRQQEVRDLQNQADQAFRERQAADSRLTSAQVEYGKLENLTAIKKEKMETLKAELELYDQADVSSPVDEIVQELMELHRMVDDLSGDISSLSAIRIQKGEAMEQLEEQLRQIRRSLSQIQSQSRQWEVQLATARTKMEHALSRLNGEYSLTYESARARQIPLDLDAAKERVKDLRTQLQRLGSVNEEAPEEYESLKERHESLCHQKADLEAAGETIRQAIAEMDQKMTAQFTDMFEKINGQLQTVFEAMFGGGRASLRLTEPDNVLESGIDIDVQPPGKLVKNIQTFSGGEKALIAISVLFAILKARTVPLCIFDEVEAALDQANVERFARYLARFKEDSQFIVVTHRPGTMEQCEDLYGITMQQDGVSTVLKVRLEEARNYAETKEGA